MAVLVFDLDGFKAVNDGLGHGVGDTLLQALSIRLLGCLDTDVVLARLGGDEFAVLLPGGDSAAAVTAVAVADTILARAAEPFQVEGRAVAVGVSIGIAHTDAAGRGAHDLLAAADIVLYDAKRDGKGRSRLFEPWMRERFTGQHALRRRLREAADRGEFVLHYQPQIHLGTKALLGCEALLRWQHPERGLCPPGEFIEMLDGTEAAESVGWWVLEEGCRQLAAWERDGLTVPSIGVNLFAAQLRAPDFVERVAATLARHRLRPERLELEITETVALQQGCEAMDTLRHVRDLGVGLAFDDFGTGYASLSTLKRVPLTRLKVDRSFITDLSDSAYDTAIVHAVLAMARGLGLRVIAEGIEASPQRDLLLGMGCTEGQGYMFGRPLPPDDFLSIYRPA